MLNLQKSNPARTFLLLTLALFFIGGLAFPDRSLAKTMYVKKSGTKLRESNSAKSDVLTKLNKGTAVKVLKKEGRFYHVSAPGGKKGWVFKFKLTSKRATSSGQDGDFLGALGGKQQMAARESSSGSSIRGLSPISEKHAKSKGISDESIKAVKQMESFRVNDTEMDRFLAEGKLGEYGE